MSVPAPAPVLLGILSGAMAGVLFLMPRLSASLPALALPLNLAGLFSATPLLVARIRGRFIHAVLATAVAILLISAAESAETGIGFALLFGLWALVAGEILARRKSVILGCIAGFAVLSLEALLSGAVEGTAPLENTLHSPAVQAAFDQWAAQVPLGPEEAKTTIEEVRSGIVALYPALSVVSAGAIVALNALALGRLASRSRGVAFPKHELLTLRWPLALVVAFVITGAMLLIPDLQTVAWNGLVVTAFLFLLQGLSVLSFGLTRIVTSELMRVLLVVASLLGPWAIFLSVLGLFDQWFDFRSRFVSSETPAAPPNQNLQ